VQISELFFELSHEGRLNILKAVFGGNKKHAQLVNELGLPGPEISRHLIRLQKMKLIQKVPNGSYQLTSFGRLLLEVIPFLENGLNFIDFINSHDFSPIPLDILLRIGSLPEVELKTMTMENIELWGELVKTATNFIYSITNQVQTSIIPIFIEQAHVGAAPEMKAIIDAELFKKYLQPEYLIPNVTRVMKEINFFDNVRIATELNISLTITDKGALIFLRSSKNIDYGQGIFGRSEEFIQATKKVFNLFWNRSRIISHLDLIVQ